MRRVTKRELNQNTAGVLGQVGDDDDVVITERGVARWRVSTVQDSGNALDRMERDGRYTPPSQNPRPWPRQPVGRSYSDHEVDEILDELRGEH